MNNKSVNLRLRFKQSQNDCSKMILDFICGIFIVFCLFPYLRILPFDLDAQPNALILSIPIIFILGSKLLLREIALILFVFVVAFCTLILSNPNLTGIRAFANYTSLFLISYSTYLSLKHLHGVPYKLFCYCVYVWLIVGAIQFFISPSFGGILTLRGEEGSMSHGRGACSLAAEPTYYGMICVFLFILNYLNFRHREKYKLLSILIGIQFLFSKSTTCVLFLGLSFGIYGMYLIFKSRHKICLLMGFIAIVLIGNYVIVFYIDNFIDSRLGSVLNVLYYNPENFILMDRSVNLRFMHAFFPIKGFFDNFGLPHGLARFNDYLVPLSQDSNWSNILPYSYNEEYRINSAIGSALFELGIFSFPLFYVIYKCIKRLLCKGINSQLCGIVLISMMLNNMPFSQAILPFVIGDLIYLCSSSMKSTPVEFIKHQ